MAGIKKKTSIKKKTKPNRPVQQETVLLALTGTAPAVLTETVWALCDRVIQTGPKLSLVWTGEELKAEGK